MPQQQRSDGMAPMSDATGAQGGLTAHNGMVPIAVRGGQRMLYTRRAGPFNAVFFLRESPHLTERERIVRTQHDPAPTTHP